MKEFGRILMMSGGVLLIAGAFFYACGKWLGLGRLPGDFFIKKESFSVYFPLASCLIVSLLLTLFFNFFKRGNS